MNDKLSFSTTAMVRSSIIEQTYSSFQRRTGLDFKKFKLRINIDPAPSVSEKKAMEVVNIAKRYFGHVDFNLSKSCSFPKAVKWCWSDISTPYLFHLEDDWRLMKDVNLEAMINILEGNNNIHQVCMRAYCNQKDLGLLPNVIRSDTAMKFARFLKDDVNPEIQLKSGECKDDAGDQVCCPHAAIQYPYQPDNTVIKDLGRLWMKSTNMVRPGNFFTAWERKPPTPPAQSKHKK
jgi:hypothetical protein